MATLIFSFSFFFCCFLGGGPGGCGTVFFSFFVASTGILYEFFNFHKTVYFNILFLEL